MPGLSDSQRRIVEYERLDRHMLVIAPPGSGKTHTITERIAWLLEQGHAQPENFLALTYTNKAGRELRERIDERRLPRVRASTLHSWAYDFLRTHGPEIGISESFQICDDFRREEILRIAAVAAGVPTLATDQLRNTGYWLSQRKCAPNAEPNQRPPFNPAIMSSIESSYQSQMRDLDLLDFDDLIVRTADLLWENREIAEALHASVRFVFVDEYHDLSLEQYRLLTAIAPGKLTGRQVLAVADPNQAIFGFRGGDAAEMIRRFRQDYGIDQPHELSENFRSGARLVHSANSLIHAGDGAVESRPMRDGADAPVVRTYTTDVLEAQLIAQAIGRAKASGARTFRDFAIVYRRHKRADLVEQMLLEHDIPVARVQPNRFFDDRLVIEGFRYLQLVAALDDKRFEPAINWPRVLMDELTMMQLRTVARSHGLGLTELAAHGDLLRQAITPLGARGIESFLGGLASGIGTVENARQGVERVLPLVRLRRDPIPQSERGNFGSTLQELAKAVDAVADTLFDALREGLCLRIQFDATNADHQMASALLGRIVENGFGASVVLGDSMTDGRCFDFSLVELDRHAGQFTTTALVYRLCQRLDERFDRSRHQRFVVFDLESTSTDIASAELLQIGAVVVENGKITDEHFCCYVRPAGPESISSEVERLTGISWKDVADGDEPAAALQAFLDFVGSTPLVGHNVDGFDLPLLRRLCTGFGLTPPDRFSIDTMKIWKRLHPGERWTLDAALTREERQARQRQGHRADFDARLTARVFIDLMREIGRERRMTLLSDELPMVAASVVQRGRDDPDNQLLKLVGRRAFSLGQGAGQRLVSDVPHHLNQPDAVSSALAAIELVADTEDEHWDRIERDWLEKVEIYERTHSDQSLQSFIRWFELAVSTDVEHDDANRVAMMSIHAAKGNEWPVVIMLGAEDDQYVFPYEPDVEEARRHFYVGMTRARDMLIVTHARQVGGEDRRPSRFLADLGLPD
jgi:superfamily I DNA/RNA helicase